jgi:hypothetical protein
MADDEFSRPFAYLKRHFRDFIQIGFLNARNAENSIEWPFDIMKHWVIYNTKVAF